MEKCVPIKTTIHMTNSGLLQQTDIQQQFFRAKKLPFTCKRSPLEVTPTFSENFRHYPTFSRENFPRKFFPGKIFGKKGFLKKKKNIQFFFLIFFFSNFFLSETYSTPFSFYFIVIYLNKKKIELTLRLTCTF